MDWIVSLTPEVADDPLAALASPPEGASVIELRLDLFPYLFDGHDVRPRSIDERIPFEARLVVGD